MRRYTFTALGIGGLVSLLILILYFVGAFAPMTNWLEEIYRSRGIFRGDEIVRLRWLEVILVIFASLGVAWCIIDVSQVGQKILVLLCALLLVTGLSPALALHNWLWEPFSSFFALLLVGAAGFVFAGTERGMRKRVLEGVVGTRVSRQTFDELLEAPDPPDFTGAVREVSILTCRIFDHAELQEKLEPAELIKMSNLFLRSVSNFLASKGAYLDESGPELVRAYFGMVHSTPDHASDACAAATELRVRLRNLSQECETRWFQPLRYGIGISSGEMTVGVYGSNEHLFFSGIGPDTDYARRLAHANHRYQSSILIGPETYRMITERFEVRPMEMFYDPESGVMSEIYELLVSTEKFGEEERKRRDLFWQGIILLREKKFEQALDHFSRARRPGEEDLPLDFFISQVQEGIAEASEDETSSESNPAPGNGHARLINLM